MGELEQALERIKAYQALVKKIIATSPSSAGPWEYKLAGYHTIGGQFGSVSLNAEEVQLMKDAFSLDLV